MKSKTNPFRSATIRGAAAVCACFTLLNPCAQATDQLWIGSAGDHDVTTASNWVGGAPSVASWSPFVFGSDVVDGTMNLNRWVAISNLTLTSGLTHDITITGSGPIVMGGSLIDMSSAGADLTVNAQLQQAWGDMTFNVGAGRTLTAAGGIGESGWFGLHTGLTKDGAGTAVLGGALNYTLATTVNGGTLQMPDGSWQLENLNIVVNSGATLNISDGNSRALSWTLNGGTVTSRGDVSPNFWGNIMLYDDQTVTVGGAAVSTIAADVMLGSNSVFAVDAGSTLNLTGKVGKSPWASDGNGDMIKTGTGTLTLTGTNTYTGNTAISAGTLAIGGAGTLGGGSYGGGMNINGALVYGSSAAQTLSGNISGTGTITQNAGLLTLSGTNTYSGATTVNGGTLVIGNAAAVGGTSGITVNSGSFLKFDSGTAGGTISTPISLIGGDYNWNMETTVANNQITFTGPITLSGSALIVSQGINSTLIFNNAFHGTDGLTFAALSGGKNFMVLSAPSDFTGDFSLVNWNGSPQVTLSGGDNRLPTTAVVRLAGSTGSPSALDLNGNNQIIAGLGEPGWGGTDAGARHVVNTSGTAVTLTLNTTANQSSGVTIGGTDINGTTGNNLSLVKTGAATQMLTGTNTYTGATTIHQGTLALGSSGSIANSTTLVVGDAGSSGAVLDMSLSGGFTVGSTQTLKGIGTVNVGAGNTLTINGTHAPGNSPGVQSVTGNLSYASGSIFEWDLASSATGTRGTQYDGVNVTGDLGGAGAIFKVVLDSGSYAENFWKSNQSWTGIFTANNTIDMAAIFSSIQWYQGASDSTTPDLITAPGYFSFTNSGTTLTWTAVPEPNGALAGLLLGAGLLRRRRSGG